MGDTQLCVERLAEVLANKTDLRREWFSSRTAELLDSFDQHVGVIVPDPEGAARVPPDIGPSEAYSPGLLSEVRLSSWQQTLHFIPVLPRHT